MIILFKHFHLKSFFRFSAETEGAMQGENGGTVDATGAGQQKAPAKQVRRIGAKPPPDRAPRSISKIL
jgi:hypothetical protein